MTPRRRSPLDRQVLGTRKFAAKPDCECGHPWRLHLPRTEEDQRGYCQSTCPCMAYRPGAVKS